MAGSGPGVSSVVSTWLSNRPRATAAPWGRHRPGVAAGAHGESLLQEGLHPAREAGLRVHGGQVPTAAQEMGETGLMGRLGKLTIGCPPIPHENPRVLGAQDGSRLSEAAATLNRIHGGVGRREGPQPPALPVDLPTRLIGCHDRTAADGGTQGRVGRPRLAGRPMQRLGDGAWGQGEPEALAQQRRTPGVREAELLVEQHEQGHGLWPQLHGGRAQRVRGLPLMAPLHASPTRHTLAQLDGEPPHDGTHDRQFFLILPGDPRVAHCAAALRTGRRQRGRPGLIHPRRDSAMGMPPMPTPSPPSGTPRGRGRRAFGERRRLAFRRPARQVELALQALVLPTQPVAVALQSAAFRLRPFKLVLQPFNLAFAVPRKR